jgi:nucleoside-diphosphate-sugar epimerase
MPTTKVTILLTGASGFIGQQFVIYNADKYQIKTVSLRNKRIEEIDFAGVDTIVHSAGIAHQMSKVDDSIYFDINTTLTKNFALAAKKAGVAHFIFLSTIKVYGEHQNIVLQENSPCEPLNDPYGQSKLEAEIFLQSIENEQFKVSIVRPPLVYGPHVKGNLIRFLKLADNGNPLPFAHVHNRRSMVFLDNLIELINAIVDKKVSGIFLATDEKPISTTYLISEIRKNLNRPLRLFNIPPIVKWGIKKLKPEMYIRLFASLEMDANNTFKKLQFRPPFTAEIGIRAMVKSYLDEKKA